jgi:hypothetical protein
VDGQVQVVGLRPPRARFRLKTRSPPHQQHIHLGWPPPLRLPQL